MTRSARMASAITRIGAFTCTTSSRPRAWGRRGGSGRRTAARSDTGTSRSARSCRSSRATGSSRSSFGSRAPSPRATDRRPWRRCARDASRCKTRACPSRGARFESRSRPEREIFLLPDIVSSPVRTRARLGSALSARFSLRGFLAAIRSRRSTVAGASLPPIPIPDSPETLRDVPRGSRRCRERGARGVRAGVRLRASPRALLGEPSRPSPPLRGDERPRGENFRSVSGQSFWRCCRVARPARSLGRIRHLGRSDGRARRGNNNLRRGLPERRFSSPESIRSASGVRSGMIPAIRSPSGSDPVNEESSAFFARFRLDRFPGSRLEVRPR